MSRRFRFLWAVGASLALVGLLWTVSDPQTTRTFQAQELPVGISTTQSGLPAASSSGIIRRLTDGIRGFFCDNGVKWFGCPSYEVNAMWFGCAADGATNDTTCLQTAINAAANLNLSGTRRVKVYIPSAHYKFTKLYLMYDAVNNPGYPSGNTDQGRMIIHGDLVPMESANLAANEVFGTVLESTDGTGPAIIADKSASPWPLRGLRLHDLTLIANNTTQVFSGKGWRTGSGFSRVRIQQKGAGGGILWEEGHITESEDLWIENTSGVANGVGLWLRNPNLAGGIYSFRFVTVNSFTTGVAIGATPTDPAQALSSVHFVGLNVDGGTNAVIIQKGARTVTIEGSHFEDYTSVGVLLRGLATTVKISGSNFHGPAATVADVQIGDSTQTTTDREARQIVLERNSHTGINARGIYREFVGTSSVGLRIKNNAFSASVGGVGDGIVLGSTVQRGAEIGPNVYANLANNVTGTDPELRLEDGSIEFGRIVKHGKGADVASGASIALGEDGNFFHITGTTNIDTITIKKAGTSVVLRFAGILTVNDGTGNLRLAGNFVTSADDILALVSDGTNWFEIARSVN